MSTKDKLVEGVDISIVKLVPRSERKVAKNGEPFFSLTATNGQNIGKSETYSSESAMENGVQSVKTNAPDAEVVDNT